jgi:hypothetical protein
MKNKWNRWEIPSPPIDQLLRGIAGEFLNHKSRGNN